MDFVDAQDDHLNSKNLAISREAWLTTCTNWQHSRHAHYDTAELARYW